jgi:hypothetical protein
MSLRKKEKSREDNPSAFSEMKWRYQTQNRRSKIQRAPDVTPSRDMAV